MLWQNLYFFSVTSFVLIVQSTEHFDPLNSRFAQEALIRIEKFEDDRRVCRCGER